MGPCLEVFQVDARYFECGGRRINEVVSRILCAPFLSANRGAYIWCKRTFSGRRGYNCALTSLCHLVHLLPEFLEGNLSSFENRPMSIIHRHFMRLRVLCGLGSFGRGGERGRDSRPRERGNKVYFQVRTESLTLTVISNNA